MILVDSSIWIDHLHAPDEELIALLHADAVATHPMVIGELAMGSMRSRRRFLELLGGLPLVREASHREVMTLIEAHGLHGRGLSLIDAHLLASVLITPGSGLLTRDARLTAAAARLGV